MRKTISRDWGMFESFWFRDGLFLLFQVCVCVWRDSFFPPFLLSHFLLAAHFCCFFLPSLVHSLSFSLLLSRSALALPTQYNQTKPKKKTQDDTSSHTFPKWQPLRVFPQVRHATQEAITFQPFPSVDSQTKPQSKTRRKECSR